MSSQLEPANRTLGLGSTERLLDGQIGLSNKKPGRGRSEVRGGAGTAMGPLVRALMT